MCKVLAISVLMLFVAGCSTPYQSNGGISGGYSEIQMDPTTVRVTF